MKLSNRTAEIVEADDAEEEVLGAEEAVVDAAAEESAEGSAELGLVAVGGNVLYKTACVSKDSQREDGG